MESLQDIYEKENDLLAFSILKQLSKFENLAILSFYQDLLEPINFLMKNFQTKIIDSEKLNIEFDVLLSKLNSFAGGNLGN